MFAYIVQVQEPDGARLHWPCWSTTATFQCQKHVVLTNEQCQMGRAKPHSPTEAGKWGKKKITPDDLKSTLNQLSPHKSERVSHITRNLLPFHTIILTDLSAASPRGLQGQSDACNSYRNGGHHLAAQKPLSEHKDGFSFFFFIPRFAKCQWTPRECRLLF